MVDEDDECDDGQKRTKTRYDSFKFSAREAISRYKELYKKARHYFGHPKKGVDNTIKVLTLIFVAAYTIITFFIWRTGKDSEERQLRAYVSLTQTNITPDASGLPDKIYVVVKNTGLTPAYAVIHRSDIKVLPFPYKGLFDLSKVTPKRFILGPGVEGPYGLSMPKDIPPDDRAEIIKGTKALWIFGEVTYRDAFFSGERITKYRMYFNGSGSIPKDGSLFQVADDGNCADDYCDK